MRAAEMLCVRMLSRANAQLGWAFCETKVIARNPVFDWGSLGWDGKMARIWIDSFSPDGCFAALLSYRRQAWLAWSWSWEGFSAAHYLFYLLESMVGRVGQIIALSRFHSKRAGDKGIVADATSCRIQDMFRLQKKEISWGRAGLVLFSSTTCIQPHLPTWGRMDWRKLRSTLSEPLRRPEQWHLPSTSMWRIGWQR